MYTLQLDISKSIAAYDDWFSYTLYLSDDLLDAINDPFTMQFSLPSYLDYCFPTLDGLYINTTTNQDGETYVYITLDNSLVPHSATSSIVFNFSCKFLPSAIKGTIFYLKPILYNSTSYLSSGVSLSPTTNYTLSLSVHRPYDTSPHPGGKIIYRALIQNLGDTDYTPRDISLTLNLKRHLFLSFDNDFTILGNELSNTSTTKFTTYITFLENHSGFVFNLNNYNGDLYELFFSTNITFASSTGDTIDLLLPCEIDNVPIATARSICKVNISLEYAYHYVATYTSPLELSHYYSYFLNAIGNTPLTSPEIKLDISMYSYILKKIITGVYTLTSNYNPVDIPYKISYSLKSSPDTRISLNDSYNFSSAYSTIISDVPNDFIDSIYINFDIIPLGMSTVSPLILVFDYKDKLFNNNFTPSGFLITDSSYTAPLKYYLESYADIYPPLLTHTISQYSSSTLSITSKISIISDILKEVIYYTFIPKGFDTTNINNIFSFEYHHNFIPSTNLPTLPQPTINTSYDTYLGTLYQIDFGSFIFLAGSELTINISIPTTTTILDNFNHYCLISSPSITAFNNRYNEIQDIISSSSFHRNFNTSLPLIPSLPITILTHSMTAMSSTLQIKYPDTSSYINYNAKLDVVSNSTILARLIVENLSDIDISNLSINTNFYDSKLVHPHITHIVKAGFLYENSLNLLDYDFNTDLEDGSHFILNNITISPNTKLILLLKIIVPYYDSSGSNLDRLLDITLNFKQHYSITNFKSPSTKLTYIPNDSYISLIGSVKNPHSLQPNSTLTNNILIIIFRLDNDALTPCGIYITHNNNNTSGYFGFNFLTPGIYSLRILGKDIVVYNIKITSTDTEIICSVDNNGFTSSFSLTDTYSTYDVYIQIYNPPNLEIISKISNSTRQLIKDCIYHQLSLNMTYEDIIRLIYYPN